MIYIITEQQDKRLKKIIFHFLDIHLRPWGGWKPETYARQLANRMSDDELFLDLEEPEEDELDEYEHIFYSGCENPNYNYTRKGDCPEAVIPNNIFDLLDDTFGKKMWQPHFLEWFEKNSGLPIVAVRKFEWT